MQLQADHGYYAALLASTHGWHEQTNDPWPWLAYFTDVLARVKRAVSGYVVDDSRMFSDGLVITKGDLSWWLDSSDTKVVTIMTHALYCE